MEGVGLTFKETYNDKTVLVTGHTGFKGGWLSLWLKQLGANVIGYSIPPTTKPSFYNIVKLSDIINKDIVGDVEDISKLSSVIHAYKPDFIFHLAAQPIVKESYKTPLETIQTNVMGTVNLLEAIRSTNHRTTCVCITSDKCYENKEWVYAYRENDTLGGHDPYSASKAAAEMLLSAYRDSFFNHTDSKCALSSARAGNVIGGGDWSNDRIVPDCIRSLSQNDIIRVRSPNAIRPWQFVLDALSGYLLLASKMHKNPRKYSGAWNFGPYPENNINVISLVNKIISKWGDGEIYVSEPISEHHEATYLKLDSTKSITQLGWKPLYGIDEAIGRTVEWYKNYYDGKSDVTNFSAYQIEEYKSQPLLSCETK
jgi:CDP-glucose 4,6-dehydratase